MGYATKHNYCFKAKAGVCTTLIVLQPEPQVQLPCVAVIPVNDRSENDCEPHRTD